MLSGFSSGLKLTNLDDFITPSQECIKPVNNENRILKNDKDKGLIEFENNSSEPQASKYEKAKITLNDCLACSGCITSAEVVLVNQQSTAQLLKVLSDIENLLEDERPVVVLSLSIQSILSLAVKYELEPQEALERIVGYFKTKGVSYVFDLNIAGCLSIIEAQQEFCARYNGQRESADCLPMLSSACPGWVCYAEKTHGFILPNISRARSPQQIMGVLVKDFWAKRMNMNSNKIYHVTVMPCFDKKLEASRAEFATPEDDSKEVDCVITSIEVEEMLDSECVDLRSVDRCSLDADLSLGPQLSSRAGTGSGGYAHHVFIHAAKHFFGVEPEVMEWKCLRNNDMHEITLEVEEEVVLRFGVANGFRNIQNLVQKMKRKKCPFDYVEVMACPSGCLNGGAQIRPTSGRSSKDLTQFLEQIYGKMAKISPEEQEIVTNLYWEYFGNDSREKLRTSYHEIEKTVNPLGIKW